MVGFITEKLTRDVKITRSVTYTTSAAMAPPMAESHSIRGRVDPRILKRNLKL